MASPPIRLSVSLLALVFACGAFAWPHAASAQIHRCTTEDGQAIYTDQKCEALGATERAPDPAPVAGAGAQSPATSGGRLYRAGCSRTLQDLVFELTGAIDARDANRLSGLYHWSGQSASAANAVMDRLEAIAGRTLADITPIFPDLAADTAVLAGPAETPHTTARRPPTGLRLEQVAANGITPASTVLGLQRHYGCWWITL